MRAQGRRNKNAKRDKIDKEISGTMFSASFKYRELWSGSE